jgi:D-alanine transaminase/branched-chain amino acid aminotransferase
MIVYFNDKFVNEEEALLHVTDMSIQRSYAIFDFFRTVNGVPLFMEDHLNRFFTSAAAMHLSISKSKEEIRHIVQELLQRSSLPEAGIRLLLTGGYSTDGYHPGTPNLLIICNPVKTATVNDFEKGFSVITYEHQRQLPHIKSINYLMAVWLQPLLKEKQADDMLYYNKESITEFPRANVFIVTPNNKLIIPARNILYGITRKNIINLAVGMMPVVERDIPLEELLHASEVFLTATTKKIIPVVKINDHIVGNGRPGPVTAKLYEKFIKLETELTHLVSR